MCGPWPMQEWMSGSEIAAAPGTARPPHPLQQRRQGRHAARRGATVMMTSPCSTCLPWWTASPPSQEPATCPSSDSPRAPWRRSWPHRSSQVWPARWRPSVPCRHRCVPQASASARCQRCWPPTRNGLPPSWDRGRPCIGSQRHRPSCPPPGGQPPFAAPWGCSSDGHFASGPRILPKMNGSVGMLRALPVRRCSRTGSRLSRTAG